MSQWKSPWVNKRVLAVSGVCETTPFAFRNHLYKVENFKAAESAGAPLNQLFHEDGCRIVDAETGRVIATPMTNCYFVTATCHEDQVYLIGGDYEYDRPWWHIRRFIMSRSGDLVNWSEPQVVFETEGESLFNNAIVHNGSEFIMLYESDDPAYPKFTFKFAKSDNLIDWRRIDGIYGENKYVGGPAMYYIAPYYYVLYVDDIGNRWQTRLTRSTDLRHWQETADDRIFLEPDYGHYTNPEQFPGVTEINASDVELIERDGKVLVYWNGGDQYTCGDHKTAEYPGTLKQLMEYFYR